MTRSCATSPRLQKAISATGERQKTIARPVATTGTTLFTAEKVTLRLVPAPAGHGIVFQRTDLPGAPRIAAKIDFVQAAPRCTILGNKGVLIQTVEHILAALRAYAVDNVLIELSGAEVPIFDGSSKRFVELLDEAGISEQEAEKTPFKLSAPVYWSRGDVHLVALPSSEYRISYTLHYPHSSLLRAQFYSTLVLEQQFKLQIAPARTFCLYEEIAPMVEQGLLKGGSLDNAVIVKEDAVLNPEGLRFPDEMARHKILDLIGDLMLIGPTFCAHVIAVCSGHASNIALAKEILKSGACHEC